MRTICLSLGVVLLSTAALAQTTTSTTSGTSTAPVLDSQAVNVLNQVIAAAGGAQTISSVSDYTATGNITYYPGDQVQGTVTIRALGALEFRMDAVLPTGTRSWVIDQGIVSTKLENGKITAMQVPTNVASSDAFPYKTPLFPTSRAFPVRPLASVLANQAWGLSYKGLTQIDGHQVHDILLQSDTPSISPKVFTPPIRTREIFVDASTFQIVMMRDSLPKNAFEEMHFSNYQAVNGQLIPFVILDKVAGEQIWVVQLNQVTLNTGLQESAFSLQ